MRKNYQANTPMLGEAVCNCCGHSFPAKNGILEEECIHIEIPFGYFSERDGEIHKFDLCEKCYNEIIKKFLIPVETENLTEFL